MSIKSPLPDLNIVVTGGARPLGTKIPHLSIAKRSPRLTVIFSRDEPKQLEL
ncbi:MAG: hypothetical protein OSA11_06555 [Candidatus Nanopelagicales bacterium]|nr:hypothetical protein [Candidatus Nanopelagicales bacterium]